MTPAVGKRNGITEVSVHLTCQMSAMVRDLSLPNSRPGTHSILDHPAYRSAFWVANRNQLRLERCLSAFVFNGGVGSSIEESSDTPRETEVGCVHECGPTLGVVR